MTIANPASGAVVVFTSGKTIRRERLGQTDKRKKRFFTGNGKSLDLV
jgi:hypothetical protein